jgi:hypothetical protein
MIFFFVLEKEVDQERNQHEVDQCSQQPPNGGERDGEHILADPRSFRDSRIPRNVPDLSL